MCKWNKWGDTRIDPCMKKLIIFLNTHGFKTIASCCGHGKYPMTIVVRSELPTTYGFGLELLNGKYIFRKKRFYKRDKKGVYFIPEVSKEK